jgi:hypothetical protein
MFRSVPQIYVEPKTLWRVHNIVMENIVGKRKIVMKHITIACHADEKKTTCSGAPKCIQSSVWRSLLCVLIP